MKAGLVRIASGSLLAIAVTGLSACNNDPLDFNVKTATQLSTNPSEMVLEGGRAQRLIVNTLNDGFEPTFDVPSLAEGTAAECTAPVTGDVSFVTLPAATGGGSAVGGPIDSVRATGAQPPDIYDVTGEFFGEACLIASFGGLDDREIPITIVPFEVIVVGPDMIVDGDFATKTYVVEGVNFPDSSVNASWDVNAPYVDVSTSDTLIAKVIGLTSPNVVELRRGPLGGTVTLTVTTDQNGVTRTGTQDIVVGKSNPLVTSITPTSGGPGEIVTIDGLQLSLIGITGGQTIVTVNGLGLANIISESATQLVVEMPTFSTIGVSSVVVDVDGALSAPNAFDFTSGFTAVGCDPGCETPGVDAISVPYDFSGALLGATTDNFFTFTASRDINIAMNLGWNDATTPGSNDIDLLVVDGAFTAYVCTDGATGANPEASDCHTVGPADFIYWVNLYAGTNPTNYTGDGSVSAFND